MTKRDLYRFVKGAIFAAPACPDGARGMACPSCAAEFIAEALTVGGYVSVED